VNQRTKRLLLWALLPLAVFIVGVINYLSGGLGEQPPEQQPVTRLDYASPAMDRTYRSDTVLRLPWGDGESSVALSTDGDGLPISTLESVIAEPDGSFLLVDHPGRHIGARARRYAADGTLLETVMTQPASTLFTSVGGRLAYVVAKQSGPSETLVIRDGSIETTWAVPLSLNSGAILAVGDDVWVTALNSEFDAEAMIVRATDVSVPVVIDGRQATDDEAAEAATDTWSVVGERAYGRRRLIEGNGEKARITQTITRIADEVELEVPGRSTAVGFDDEGLVYVWTAPVEFSDRTRELPATLQSAENVDEVLVGTFGGTIVGRIIIPGSTPTVGGWLRLSVSRDGSVLAAVSGPEGVRIVRYTVVDSDG